MTTLYKYITIIVSVIIVGLGIAVVFLSKSNNRLKEDLSISKSNEKAFIAENDELKDRNRVFQFQVEQLEYFNDSLTMKMNEVRKELKIKDKDLKQMQYLLSEAQRKDTVVFRDTILRDNTVMIDTLFGDRWYTLRLGLVFPNTIIVEPTFVSEKYIITSYRKETIDLPKKCFIARWFQKKHKIVEVEVIEKNPYITNKQQKFIDIID